MTNTEAFEAGFLTAFGMTKGGIQIIIHSGFQPSAEGVALFPNASHWAELMRPFRALTTVSKQINN